MPSTAVAPEDLRGDPAPRAASLYRSRTHEEALARLHYLVDERKRLGRLVGPGGSGKTQLLSVLADELRRRACHVIATNVYSLSADEFLWQLAAGWYQSPAVDAPVGVLWRGITDAMRAAYYQQTSFVLLVDDADRAPAELLDCLVRLVKFDAAAGARQTVVLAGRDDRAATVGPQLLELANLRIQLEPWSVDDVERFVVWHLEQQRNASTRFTPTAIELLHALAHGNPRATRETVELALVAAAASQATQVEAGLIDAVSAELSTQRA